MPTATINGIELYYEIHGAGPPLMLVAGLASDSQSWQPIIAELSQRYTLILPDNRGVGRTSPQETGGSIGQMADDCVALLRHLHLPSVHLLGHSMGGFIALDCALRYPGQFDHLILVATAAANSARNNVLMQDWAAYLESGMDLESWFRNVFYWIFTTDFFQDKDILNGALRYAIDYPYPQSTIAFKNQVNAIAQFNCQPHLAAIKHKTLVLGGQEDLLFSLKEISALQEIPGSLFAIIENAAHSIHMECPEAFIRQVLHFLGDHSLT